jgi:hypothetical protein
MKTILKMIQINIKTELIYIKTEFNCNCKFDWNFESLYVADIGKHTSLPRRQQTEVG